MPDKKTLEPQDYVEQINRQMTDEEREAWQTKSVKDLWRIFRIQSEFVEGFETMSEIGPSVSIFGSARTQPDNPYYQLGVDVAEELVRRGYGVITGGGPGIMEAGNKGARNMDGASIGLNIELPHEQGHNPYIDSDKLINFHFFFVRKTIFRQVQPGLHRAAGRLWHARRVVREPDADPDAQDHQVSRRSDGRQILDRTRSTGCATRCWPRVTSAPNDMHLFQITDDPKEAVDIVDEFYKEHSLSPNF